MREAGFSRLRYASAKMGGRRELRAVMVAGRRKGASRAFRLDHEAVRHGMDPRDRGEGATLRGEV